MLHNKSMSLKLEKIIFITINYTTKHTARRRRQRGCRQRRLQLRLRHLRWFRRIRCVLWTYCKHPFARFRRRRRGRQSKHGRRRGDFGGAKTIVLRGKWGPMEVVAKFGKSATTVPLTWMFPMRGHRGRGSSTSLPAK